MSVPFGGGAQPAAPQHHGARDAFAGQDLGFILALVVAGLGLVIYACSFSDDAGSGADLLGNVVILPLLLAGGVLAGVRALLKRPGALQLATLFTVLGTLLLLLTVIKDSSDTPAIMVVITIAALLQCAACVIALLLDNGVIKLTPRVVGYGPPPSGWSPQVGGVQQPGYSAYPQQGQYGVPQYGGAPQYGQPGAGQAPPAPPQPGGGSAQPPGQGQGGQGGGAQPESRPPTQFGQQPYGGQQPYTGGAGAGGAGHGQQGSPPAGF
jgi:hypothetical protein